MYYKGHVSVLFCIDECQLACSDCRPVNWIYLKRLMTLLILETEHMYTHIHTPGLADYILS